MSPRRGRTVACWSAVIGLGLILASAWGSRKFLLERWHIHRLGAQDPPARKLAAERLGEMRSRRAAPALARAAFFDEDAEVRKAAQVALRILGPNAIPALIEYIETERPLPGLPVAYYLLMEAQSDQPQVSSLLENLGYMASSEPLTYTRFIRKHLAWISDPVAIEGRHCLILLFDSPLKEWPGSQPQTIAIIDAEGRLLAWEEVGGQPMYESAELVEAEGGFVLRITCRERPRGVGVYSYRLSAEGIERIAAEYPGP